MTIQRSCRLLSSGHPTCCISFAPRDYVLRSQQPAKADALREFLVLRQRVHDALLWLMEHNRYYGDISVSVENLEQLPDDGPPQLRLNQYVTEHRRAHW